MKTIGFYFVFSFLLVQSLLAQEFQLSDIPSESYTIDKFSQTVYAKDLFSDTVREINLSTMEVVNTNYQILPVFGNTKHIAAYALETTPDNSNYEIYLYNFQNDSTWLLIDSAGYLYNLEGIMKFSPNDQNLYYANNYFSFDDSSTHSLQIIGLDPTYLPKWNSDSTLIYISNSNSILQYSINSKKTDTLVTVSEYEDISGYSYNKKYHILAYSIYEDPPKIYFHYTDKNIPDSIIFDPARDEPDVACWQTFIALTWLSWSPDEKNLAFFTTFGTLSSAGIYLYNLDSNKVFHITDCGHYGLKYFLHWANNDTIIYSDASRQRLFGFDISSAITSINFRNNINSSIDFTISSYPNPFNLSTTINIDYNLYDHNPIKIKVYDILGKLIKSINVSPQTKEVIWNARDNSGKIVTSGVYFVTAEINNKVKSNVIKVILTK